MVTNPQLIKAKILSIKSNYFIVMPILFSFDIDKKQLKY